MTPRQILADVLGVPVGRVRKARVLWWAVVARTGPVRWHYEAANDFPGSGWLTASTAHYTIRVEPSPRRPLHVLVAEIRAGLAAMGVRVPTIILSRDGATLYALRAGAPEAIGYVNATHVCVYERDGGVKHRREHYGDPRAVLVSELGRYWPGEVVG